MALGHSPSIVRNGLVFYYDMNNTKKSWKGKPTTNLYTNGHFAGGNHVTQAQNGSLSNPVNEVIAMKNPGSSDYCLRTTSVGGSPYTEYEIYLSGILTANTTYCLSCWYALSPDWNGNDTVFHSRWWNADGSEQGALGGGGWTVAETKVVGSLTWKRVYITFTTGATTNGNHSWYAGYPAQNTAGYRYFTDFQIETGSTPTPFSNGARSNTQAILDITNNYTITANNLNYNNDNTFNFNGSNSNLDSPPPNIGNFSIDLVAKWTSSLSDVFACGTEPMGSGISGGTYIKTHIQSNGMFTDLYSPQVLGGGWKSGNVVSGSFTTNTTYNITIVNSGTIWYYYSNGVYLGSYDHTYLANTGSSRTGIFRNHVQIVGNAGYVYAYKQYNRALTASEVLQNFNAHRSIYGI